MRGKDELDDVLPAAAAEATSEGLEEAKLCQWRREQALLRHQFVQEDDFDWMPPPLLSHSVELCQDMGVDGSSSGSSGCGSCGSSKSSSSSSKSSSSSSSNSRSSSRGGGGGRSSSSSSSYSRSDSIVSPTAQLSPSSLEYTSGHLYSSLRDGKLTVASPSHLIPSSAPYPGKEKGVCLGGWEKECAGLLVGGVDVSYSKLDPDLACVGLVVMRLPSMEVRFEEYQVTRAWEPYVPGFLAFRECLLMEALLLRVRECNSQWLPQVVMVDGNGTLHPEGFGSACHLGVKANMPAIGVAKKLYELEGLRKSTVRALSSSRLHNPGDWAQLIDRHGVTMGAVVRGGGGSSDPIYVSPGHRISLPSAVAIVQRCLLYRVPEPIRQADLRSRARIRELELEMERARSI